MDENIDWDLLGKYLFGECSDEEEVQVQAWVNADPSREVLLDELRQVWETTEQPPPQWDVDGLWERVHDHMQQGERVRPLRPANRPPAPRESRFSRSTALFLRVAALFAVVAITALVATQMQQESQPEASKPKSKIFATERGERATLQLTDGTQVRLNAASTLKISPHFSTHARTVQLAGEAFFDVARNASRPFVIQAGGAVTQVLGTSFNVDAYPEQEGVRVVVVEGKVALSSDRSSSKESVVLLPRQMGALGRDGEQVVRKMVDLNHHLDWTEDRLVFEDAPFDEVARRLERWYDLEIQLEDVPETVGQINAIFENESLSEILNVVATTLDLKYRKRQRRVVFYRATEA